MDTLNTRYKNILYPKAFYIICFIKTSKKLLRLGIFVLRRINIDTAYVSVQYQGLSVRTSSLH